jgi:hypothetical protein
VRLADGSKTLLSAVKNTKGGSHTGAMTGAIVATSLIVWPAAPFFLFMHGKDITIPKGTAITAFVQGDDVLDRARFLKSIQQAQSAAPAAPASPAAPSAPQAQGPTMQVVSPVEPSLGDVARQNRAQKGQQQNQQPAQQQAANPQ